MIKEKRTIYKRTHFQSVFDRVTELGIGDSNLFLGFVHHELLEHLLQLGRDLALDGRGCRLESLGRVVELRERLQLDPVSKTTNKSSEFSENRRRSKTFNNVTSGDLHSVGLLGRLEVLVKMFPQFLSLGQLGLVQNFEQGIARGGFEQQQHSSPRFLCTLVTKDEEKTF
jgi:hypothetical protein